MDGMRRSFVPVKVGDELEVKIDAVGEKGDGIAKINGFVLFVPNTKQGESVKIKITRVLRKVGFAEVIGKGDSLSGESEEGASADKQEEPAEESPEDTEDFGEDLEDSDEEK